MGKTGHLTQEEINGIIEDRKLDNFIETGTYLGDSTLEASKVFTTVHTMEIVPDLQRQAIEKCSSANNIHFHLGDTVKLLPDIVQNLTGGCLWFLDAHQSGPETSNNGVHVPLLHELDIILDNMNRSDEHVFIIDDVRLFSAYWDWANISIQSIIQKFSSRDLKITRKNISNDRLVIYL